MLHLQQRAALLAAIRQFFTDKSVLEVETPLLNIASVPSLNVPSIEAQFNPYPDRKGTTGYLQTSPELAMKRLLVAGSGSIYQLCKAFRNEASGPRHRPEFTLLEWYRVGFDHHQLMDEVDEFLQRILNTQPAERVSYQALFQRYLKIDPLSADKTALAACVKKAGIELSAAAKDMDKDGYLDLLMSHCLESKLGHEKPVFIDNYPASQAALARINPQDPRTAQRFEVYVKGIELANGFHELQDAKEQRQRFEHELAQRKQQGLPTVALDEAFLQALEQGLPDCAGVALGVDRLLMLMMGAASIGDVLSFGGVSFTEQGAIS
jgi:elongation factor P--(R)-beta-lysine ligase